MNTFRVANLFAPVAPKLSVRVVVLALSAAPLLSHGAYKCAEDGRTVYQDMPCASVQPKVREEVARRQAQVKELERRAQAEAAAQAKKRTPPTQPREALASRPTRTPYSFQWTGYNFDISGAVTDRCYVTIQTNMSGGYCGPEEVDLAYTTMRYVNGLGSFLACKPEHKNCIVSSYCPNQGGPRQDARTDSVHLADGKVKPEASLDGLWKVVAECSKLAPSVEWQQRLDKIH